MKDAQQIVDRIKQDIKLLSLVLEMHEWNETQCIANARVDAVNRYNIYTELLDWITEEDENG